MPLRLLGKKSWNVYNPENIARVKRDEVHAQARNEQREREDREKEASTRLHSLRGEEQPAEPTTLSRSYGREPRINIQSRDNYRKRRKLHAEDDTDRDIRLARIDLSNQHTEQHDSAVSHSRELSEQTQGLQHQRSKVNSLDTAQESPGMRFKDAAGYGSSSRPWYADHQSSVSIDHRTGKDIWGNEDPRRQEREQQRLSANDPLLMMKKGVKQLRENEKHRKQWLEQREKDLYEVERLGRTERNSLRRHSNSENSLEEFSLDRPTHSVRPRAQRAERDSEQRSRERHQHHKRKHRSRSPDRAGRHRHRHRHQYRNHENDRMRDRHE